MPRRNEMKTGAASSEKAFYEALCVLHASGVSSTQKYEAQLTLHEAALRAMKRILDPSLPCGLRRDKCGFVIFLLKIRAKKIGCKFLFPHFVLTGESSNLFYTNRNNREKLHVNIFP